MKKFIIEHQYAIACTAVVTGATMVVVSLYNIIKVLWLT